MKRSMRRILTTHTGSLPRPADLLTLLNSKEAGELADAGGFETSVRDAVNDIVRKQVEAGVDVVNDGEMSKPGYSTYIKDRLSGFGGESPGLGGAIRLSDLRDFPDYAARMFSNTPVATLKTPACDGPIRYRETHDLERDIENLKNAAEAVKAEEVFMSAASPGVIALFLQDHHYRSHEAYVAAIAAAMKTEYDAIYQAG